MTSTQNFIQSTTLDQLKLNCPALISSVATSDCQFRAKLNALGIVDGVEVTVLQAQPFGGPLSIKVLGSVLSLRRSEADKIAVKSLA